MFDLHHLRDNKTSYMNHLCFAAWIGARLLLGGTALVVHAILPIVKMPKSLSLGGLSDYLFDKDYQIRQRILGPDSNKKTHHV
jgi:hypothetical protein